MSGHSKWSTIKHKKGRVDAKRGKLFTKLNREITVAAREHGGDESSNPRLRLAVQNARTENMPSANIQRAIKKGTGELPGESYEAGVYEGYGPGGVAILVEVLTDNKNRTVSEIRHVFSKYNGNMAENGSVAWLFEQKGLIVVAKSEVDEETLMGVVLDAGAEDLVEEDATFEVCTAMQDFEPVRKALEMEGIGAERSELTRVPQNTVSVEGKTARQLLVLLEALEDQDDVQRVFANFEMDDRELEALVAS